MFGPEARVAAAHLAMAGLLAAPMVAAIPGASRAADGQDKLRRLERSLDESRSRRQALRKTVDSYAAEIETLKRRMVVVARKAQDHEANVSQLEEAIGALFDRQAAMTDSLRRRRRELAGVLAALERLARRPPVALAALPASPTDTVRSAILLRSTVPRLERRARDLKRDLAELAALRSRISRRRSELTAAGGELNRERRRLGRLIEEKSRLQHRARTRMWAARARIAELAAEAEDLRDLLDRLSRGRRPVAPRPAARRRAPAPGKPPAGALAVQGLPARGRIIRSFGDKLSGAVTAKGVTIETRPAAQVVAPRAGGVVFAGPFKGYGELLIIEYDEGYHILLAGMSRVDAVVGDEVLAGEPVGAMESSSDTNPKLYLELRRKGLPINPLPWLAATRDKVNG